MKNQKEQKPQRILARLTAREITPEELANARGGADDNQDVGGCGCGGGVSTALATSPWGQEDS